MSFHSFQVTSQDGVAEIVLSRPERMNSFTTDTFMELPRAIAQLEEDGETRVILISAQGKHFSSGMDLAFFAGDLLNTASPLDRERFRRLVLVYQDALSSVEKSRIPVVAAVHGACVGAGVDLVSACDMRYATRDAFFCIQEINLGMMADLGTLQRLPKIMPEGVVRELAYTGDKLDAERGLKTGLLNDVFESHEDMMKQVRLVCERIAKRSPLAVAASKEAITYVRDHSVTDALYHAANWQASIFDKPQVLEAIEAQKNRKVLAYANLHSSPAG